MNDTNEPFDSELTAELRRRAKKQIRARMLALRGGHPQSALAARSAALVSRLSALPVIAEARSLALFWPMEGRGEVDLRTLFRDALERGVRVYLPFQRPNGPKILTGFGRVSSEADLAPQGRGFWGPSPDAAPAVPGEVDVVVVPALAVDLGGHRIGYGAGYYDATLGDVSPPAVRVVVAYEFQLLSELPAEPHDLPCDWIVTDSRTVAAERTDAELRAMNRP